MAETFLKHLKTISKLFCHKFFSVILYSSIVIVLTAKLKLNCTYGVQRRNKFMQTGTHPYFEYQFHSTCDDHADEFAIHQFIGLGNSRCCHYRVEIVNCDYRLSLYSVLVTRGRKNYLR